MAGQERPRYGGDVRISDDEWVKDPKTGEMRLSEKGITRQKEDILALAERLGVDVGVWYEENDTTAFKKKRIKLPNGRSVWRVIRPEFRRMLRDYEDGRIDGVIFYDVDRLARQPRDLEDLIDLVEVYKLLVESVTGQIDLRTSNGRAMVRVLVAMANKSSEDTSRRVARARLQGAQQGGNRQVQRRRLGYRAGKVVPEEAKLINEMADRFLAGASWMSLVSFMEASGVRPIYARAWTINSVQQVLLNPATAGIAVYNGVLRAGNEGKRSPAWRHDPEGISMKTPSGEYVMGEWPSILTVKRWKAVVDEHLRRRKGMAVSAQGTRRYLLSGILRCGRIRADGQVCNRALSGFSGTRRSGARYSAYRCPPKAIGGCGSLQRSMPEMDKLIEELLFRYIAENMPTVQDENAAPADPDGPDAKDLSEVNKRLRMLRAGFAEGTTSADTMFTVVPMLEARARDLKAKIAKTERAHAGRVIRAKPIEEVRREWDAGDIEVRRAILSRYLKAVVVRKATTWGYGKLDYSAIEPVWHEDAGTIPDDELIEQAISDALADL